MAFIGWKKMVTSDRCIMKYHPYYTNVIFADASSYGLGAVLLKTQPTGDRQTVAFASGALDVTEQRYSQTKKEDMAAARLVQSVDGYVRGISFEVEDQLPLVSLSARWSYTSGHHGLSGCV